MKFRPCIDIHNGSVKQIVGSSLKDEGDRADENFVAEKDASYYADMFRKDGLTGGHIILLNHKDSPYFEATKVQALRALSVWPGGMQIGGGITAENAAEFIEAGASHVIVTSYVFFDGKISFERLEKLCEAVGKNHVVLDLSCRKKEGSGAYFIMTDRWQKYTELPLDEALMEKLADYCDEFLVHAIEVEGKGAGIDLELAGILAKSPIPVTYAGGIHSLEDIEILRKAGSGKIDYTIGSALDLYGGRLLYSMIASLK